MRKTFLFTMSVIILAFLGTFTATAFAADAVTPVNGSLMDYAKPIFDAVMHGQLWLGASLAVVLLCAAARKYMPAKWTEGTRGDITGVGLAFLMAFASALAAALATPGAAVSLALMATAGKVGLGAIGGWTILHKVLGWLADWKAMPSWLRALLALVGSVIGSDAITKAQAAGDAAVKASPATGLADGAVVKEIE